MIQPYNKLVSKGVCFLGTFQKYIFEILELIFHVILPFPKGVPFEVSYSLFRTIQISLLLINTLL
ncbi:hypothetical protein EXW34_29390 (plasmid) [Bacillus mycoides]|nr:hypothetical protein EXW34_29390 [Bacillus mycoides]